LFVHIGKAKLFLGEQHRGKQGKQKPAHASPSLIKKGVVDRYPIRSERFVRIEIGNGDIHGYFSSGNNPAGGAGGLQVRARRIRADLDRYRARGYGSIARIVNDQRNLDGLLVCRGKIFNTAADRDIRLRISPPLVLAGAKQETQKSRDYMVSTDCFS
jgi:hypothetical protein